jgi:hypothetical protein
VDELADVLGMPHELFERLAPHVTVLTTQDPDVSTRDPVVARALADAAGVAQVTTAPSTGVDDAVLRVIATAVGPGDARYVELVIATANFRNATPRVNILLRRRLDRAAGGDVVASGAVVSGSKL